MFRPDDREISVGAALVCYSENKPPQESSSASSSRGLRSGFLGGDFGWVGGVSDPPEESVQSAATLPSSSSPLPGLLAVGFSSRKCSAFFARSIFGRSAASGGAVALCVSRCLSFPQRDF